MNTVDTTLRRQRGLTLIELMIAMLLSLLLLAGVLYIFSASSQANRTNMALSRVAETGRFGLDFIAFDIRNAGYKGRCLTPVNNLLNQTSPAYNPDFFDLNDSIRGWNNEAGPHSALMTGYVPNTDALLLKHGAIESGLTANGIPANAATITVTPNNTGIPAGTIMLISDAEGCDLFQKTNNANAAGLARGASGTPGNVTPGGNPLSHSYAGNVEVMQFRSVLYYVGLGASGQPSLRRLEFSNGSVQNLEIVEGVSDLQIEYGVDTALTPNGRIDAYLTANNVADWTRVLSVRLNLLAVSPEPNVAVEPQTLTFNGTTVTIPDNRLGHVFSSTIGLRNRLP